MSEYTSISPDTSDTSPDSPDTPKFDWLTCLLYLCNCLRF